MSNMEVVDHETGELVPYEPPSVAMSLLGTTDPDEITRETSRISKSLIRIIEQQRLFAPIGGKKYVTVEGWKVLGTWTQIYAVGEGEPEYVNLDGIVGFKATVLAVRPLPGGKQQIFNRATAYCMRDEAQWKNRDLYALASMAQTRAASKALRGPLDFIVKMAGYEGTPAEEMPPEVVQVVEAPPSQFRAPTPRLSTRGQQTKLHTLITKLDKDGVIPEERTLAGMQTAFGTTHTAELTFAQAHDLIGRLEAKETAAEAEGAA